MNVKSNKKVSWRTLENFAIFFRKLCSRRVVVGNKEAFLR